MKSYYVELTDIGKSRVNVEEIETDNLADNEAIIKKGKKVFHRIVIE